MGERDERGEVKKKGGENEKMYIETGRERGGSRRERW
jgi:hypothetical protein